MEHTPFEDKEILEIVTEETAPYFAGDKTIEEVTAVIQRRCSLYLEEGKAAMRE